MDNKIFFNEFNRFCDFKKAIEDGEITMKDLYQNQYYVGGCNFNGTDNIYMFDEENNFGVVLIRFRNNKLLTIQYFNTFDNTNRNNADCSEQIQYLNDKYLFQLYNDQDYSTIESYNDYKSKKHYLINEYMRDYDKISCFHIGEYSEEEKELLDNIYICFNKNSLGYYRKEAECAILKQNEMIQQLRNMHNEKLKNDKKYLFDAYLCELSNFEYCYFKDNDEALKAVGIDTKLYNDNIVLLLVAEYVALYNDYGITDYVDAEEITKTMTIEKYQKIKKAAKNAIIEKAEDIAIVKKEMNKREIKTDPLLTKYYIECIENMYRNINSFIRIEKIYRCKY